MMTYDDFVKLVTANAMSRRYMSGKMSQTLTAFDRGKEREAFLVMGKALGWHEKYACNVAVVEQRDAVARNATMWTAAHRMAASTVENELKREALSI